MVGKCGGPSAWLPKPQVSTLEPKRTALRSYNSDWRSDREEVRGIQESVAPKLRWCPEFSMAKVLLVGRWSRTDWPAFPSLCRANWVALDSSSKKPPWIRTDSPGNWWMESAAMSRLFAAVSTSAVDSYSPLTQRLSLTTNKRSLFDHST